jgi:insertion element IS1 protein InsB
MFLRYALDAECYATDGFRAYNKLPPQKHLIGKAHTFTVEGKNSQLRHYLARFHRRTKCYSKAVHMIFDSLTL